MYGFSTTQILGLVVNIVLPIVVAFVTKESLPRAAKSFILAGLTAVTSVATEALTSLTAHTGFAWQGVVLQGALGWALAVATHYGLWKPSGITTAVAKTGVTDGSTGNYAGSTLPPSAAVPVTPPVTAPAAVPPSTGK